MKAILLVSSIFYIIGLTIGNKIELTTKNDTAKTVITNEVLPSHSSGTIEYDEAAVSSAEADSLKTEIPEK